VRHPLAVRRATVNDLDVVVELRLALLREYRDHPFYGRLRPDFKARAYELYRAQLDSSHEQMFVAERDGVIVGVLRCIETAVSPVLLPERYGYISSVYVRPSERRRGVLSALLGAAEAWCDVRGIPEMRLHNSATSREARDAWNALGFDVVEEMRRRDVRSPRTPVHAAAHPETGAH
jgi:GNAT superfamily N-acetyltransferase